MKSYDDLQRFKEKTQTNHIEFKDMSEQTRNSDNTDWAIIKQLMNDGAASALGNGQRTDIAAPQPVADLFSKAAEQALPQKKVTKVSASPGTGVAAFVTAKPVAQGSSLLDSIAASLKPVAQVQPAVAEPLMPAPAVQETLVAKPETVNPLDITLAQKTASPLEVARAPQTTSLLDAVRAQQPAGSAAAHSQQTASPLSAAAHSQQTASPLSAAAPSQPTASPLGAAAHSQQPASPLSAAASSQPTASRAAAEPDVRFRQLFSASGTRDATILPKETLLQPLLERIASCR